MKLFQVVCILFGSFLLFAVASCSDTEQPTRTMKAMVHGVICDPEHSTLLAEGTNETQIDSFDDLRRVELYRTVGGHYFVQNELGYNLSLQLLPRTEAMQLYSSLPQHRLDFSQAFAG